MKKKLSLESIKIKSFVTSLNNYTTSKIIGGETTKQIESDDPPCDSNPYCLSNGNCEGTENTQDTRPAMCPTGPLDLNCNTQDSKGQLISACC